MRPDATPHLVNIGGFQTEALPACTLKYTSADYADQYAFKSHGIHVPPPVRPLLRNTRDEQPRLIELLQQGRREDLVALCVGHLHPPWRACIEADEQIFELDSLQQV